jgi:16S rRNA (guanine527-N7)-methyltransferase
MQIGSQEWSDLIIEGAQAFDIDLNPGQTRQFAVHAVELVRWNQKINITAITDPFEVAVKHFLDSLPAARFLPPDANLLDIGSGGGFPGLPLKVILPSLSITLIDASRKKVNFLKHVVRTLKLENVEALHIRAEDLANDPLYRNRFDVIVSRAVSSLKLFRRLAWPLLTHEGVVVALKGDIANDELTELQGRGGGGGEPVEAVARQFSATVEKYHLPFLNSNRSIVVFAK